MHQTMFTMQIPEEMAYALDVVSASHGLSRSEYVRLAATVALNAEPVVTPEIVAKMRETSAYVKSAKRAHNRGNQDHSRDLQAA